MGIYKEQKVVCTNCFNSWVEPNVRKSIFITFAVLTYVKHKKDPLECNQCKENSVAIMGSIKFNWHDGVVYGDNFYKNNYLATTQTNE